MGRLDILKNSLEKKQKAFDDKLSIHMEDVKGAQGEPMAGHRGGNKVLNRWEKQNKTLHSLNEGIEKTKRAIEIEESKIERVENSKDFVPEIFFKLVYEGFLTQWRKHPSVFFVVGVDKARIGWDNKKKTAYHKYYRMIEDETQKKLFKDAWVIIYNKLNKK